MNNMDSNTEVVDLTQEETAPTVGVKRGADDSEETVSNKKLASATDGIDVSIVSIRNSVKYNDHSSFADDIASLVRFMVEKHLRGTVVDELAEVLKANVPATLLKVDHITLCESVIDTVMNGLVTEMEETVPEIIDDQINCEDEDDEEDDEEE